VTRPWGEWWTVAFVNWDRAPSTFGIAWDELGLDPGTSCHVWDFWREHSAGEKTQRVDADVGKESCEVYFLTPAKPHPQVIGSTRHVVAGAVGLEDVRWDEERMCLSGRTIQSLPGWPVRVFVSVPDPWRVSGVEGAHAHVAQAPDAQGHVTLTLNADGDWKILFEKGPASVT
jgi:hypothetical protein